MTERRAERQGRGRARGGGSTHTYITPRKRRMQRNGSPGSNEANQTMHPTRTQHARRRVHERATSIIPLHIHAQTETPRQATHATQLGRHTVAHPDTFR